VTDLIVVKDDGPVRIVRINRPEKKNALTMPMYAGLTRAFEIADDAAIRCIMIAGAPGAFSAGNDLNEFSNAAAGGEGLGQEVLQFLHALIRSPVPLVAAVDGLAVGVGTTMLMHCDYVVASETSRFSTPFVQLGLVPEAASSLVAPRLMGHRRAFALLVMGRSLDAQQAMASGLVNEVVASSDVERRALDAAREIAALPPQAVAASRRLIRSSPDELAARIDDEAALFKKRLATDEARAAFAAFFSRKR
jgi:enoyl-CoA hydratase/carnithine racemase